MKKNNKGFMLIEVIVTSTIVVTTMILLYSSFNKLSNNYKSRNSYYNLDATYATKEMINSMLKNNEINKFVNAVIPHHTYEYIIKQEDENQSKCVTEISNSDAAVGAEGIKIENQNCSSLQSLYSIKNMIFLEYDTSSLDALSKENINQTLKEYIEYIKKYYDIKGIETEYSYIVLTEVEEDGNYYYASLRMR